MSWAMSTLGKVCTVVTDGTHKTPKYQKSGVRFISIKNVRPYSPINWSIYEKYISEPDHAELIKKAHPEKDDILFPRIGTLGFAKRIDFEEEVSIFVGLGLAKPDRTKIRPKFLEYYMNTSFVDQYSRREANGSGRLTLPLAASRKMPVPLPSLEEQDAIVAKIEELFSEIDSSIHQLIVASCKLSLYKQALLNSLFSGKEVTKLGELLDDVRYGTSKKCGLDNSLTPVLRIPNIARGTVDLSDLKYASFDANEAAKLSLKIGDLLVIRSNGSQSIVGRCAEVTKDTEGYLFAGYLIRLRFNPDLHSAKFYKYLLSSPKLREQIEFKAKSTSGVNNINSDELRSLVVPKLDIHEQNEIVRILDEKESEIESLENSISRALKQMNNSKQSILARAFKGELV